MPRSVNLSSVCPCARLRTFRLRAVASNPSRGLHTALSPLSLAFLLSSQSVSQKYPQQVLRGARPDLQDLKFKSALEHAKKHPNVLWQLENQLKRQRKFKRLRVRALATP